MLQVDANSAYRRADVVHLAQLDQFSLLLIEQPLDEDDLVGHAQLARRIATPVCLDESIVSAQSAATAISLGACSVVNIKAGRVGGYLEARAVHDVCASRNVPVWCGGMLETGLGRAANLALASLPGFTLPGDISATDALLPRGHHPPVPASQRHHRGPHRPRPRRRGSPPCSGRPHGSVRDDHESRPLSSTARSATGERVAPLATAGTCYPARMRERAQPSSRV